MSEANAYSPTWHAVFGAAQPEEVTAREIAFLSRQLPLPHFGQVLDVCCGFGRHLQGLAGLGHAMTGLERDPAVAVTAREAAPDATVIVGDALGEIVPGAFDAVVCLWASFGWFDDRANAAMLGAMAEKIRPGGRLVLDVSNREFFTSRTGERVIERTEHTIVEHTRLDGNRLRCTLAYANGAGDTFDWQLFTPAELCTLGKHHGLEPLLACATYDERTSPSAEEARMQVVFEKPVQ